jgi:hypothetical protein
LPNAMQADRFFKSCEFFGGFAMLINRHHAPPLI